MFISVVMPAYKAQHTIANSVRSALAQTYGDFELVISIDDQFDYAKLLHDAGIIDDRIKFTDTGAAGTGSSNARNKGLEKATARYTAVLDADDQFTPNKLQKVREALEEHPLVTTGLDVRTQDNKHLRFVGCDGSNRQLKASEYKFTNLSMDSMVAHDREKVPIIYDVELPCLVDLGLMLTAFTYVPYSFHIAEPLHIYFKQNLSISIGPEASARYIRIKKLLLERLKSNFYPLAEGAAAINGIAGFLERSLAAEEDFEAALAENPGLIFENHLESRLSNLTR